MGGKPSVKSKHTEEKKKFFQQNSQREPRETEESRNPSRSKGRREKRRETKNSLQIIEEKKGFLNLL